VFLVFDAPFVCVCVCLHALFFKFVYFVPNCCLMFGSSFSAFCSEDQSRVTLLPDVWIKFFLFFVPKISHKAHAICLMFGAKFVFFSEDQC